MQLPQGYTEALMDELAPLGLAFESASPTEDGDVLVVFAADPEDFARSHPWLGIEGAYGATWPPARLTLELRYDRHGDPIQAEFETIDLLAATASMDPGLHDRLNTIADPLDQAAAVGQALSLLLAAETSPEDFLS